MTAHNETFVTLPWSGTSFTFSDLRELISAADESWMSLDELAGLGDTATSVRIVEQLLDIIEREKQA